MSSAQCWGIPFFHRRLREIPAILLNNDSTDNARAFSPFHSRTIIRAVRFAALSGLRFCIRSAYIEAKTRRAGFSRSFYSARCEQCLPYNDLFDECACFAAQKCQGFNERL